MSLPPPPDPAAPQRACAGRRGRAGAGACRRGAHAREAERLSARVGYARAHGGEGGRVQVSARAAPPGGGCGQGMAGLPGDRPVRLPRPQPHGRGAGRGEKRQKGARGSGAAGQPACGEGQAWARPGRAAPTSARARPAAQPEVAFMAESALERSLRNVTRFYLRRQTAAGRRPRAAGPRGPSAPPQTRARPAPGGPLAATSLCPSGARGPGSSSSAAGGAGGRSCQSPGGLAGVQGLRPPGRASWCHWGGEGPLACPARRGDVFLLGGYILVLRSA